MPVELGRRPLPPGVAEDIESLITAFRTKHPHLTLLHEKGIRLSWEESEGRKSLRVSRSTEDGVESVILVIDPEQGGGVHWIKTSKSSLQPEVDSHTHTAIVKAYAFLHTVQSFLPFESTK